MAELLNEAAALEARAAKLKGKAQAPLDEDGANERARQEAMVQAKLAEIGAAEKEAAALLAKIETLKAGLPKA